MVKGGDCVKISSLSIIIESNVDKGIYLFEPISATGKTRLCDLIETLKEREFKVSAYYFSDYIDGIQIERKLKGKKLFVMDRVDMYSSSDISDVIEKYRDKCLILLDLKYSHLGDGFLADGVIEIELLSPDVIRLEDPFV